MYGVQLGRGEGGQNRPFFAYVIYGWPLTLHFEIFNSHNLFFLTFSSPYTGWPQDQTISGVFKTVYPPNFSVFMAQTSLPIFIGMPCTNTMFNSQIFPMVPLRPQGVGILDECPCSV